MNARHCSMSPQRNVKVQRTAIVEDAINKHVAGLSNGRYTASDDNILDTSFDGEIENALSARDSALHGQVHPDYED